MNNIKREGRYMNRSMMDLDSLNFMQSSPKDFPLVLYYMHETIGKTKLFNTLRYQ